MAAKRKTKKKHPKLKKTVAKRGIRVKKPVRKKLAKKNSSPKKKLVKKRPALKKAAAKTKASGKRARAKTPLAARKPASGGNQSLDTETFAAQGLRSRSAGQSGDLQGLSDVEGADSESVDELIEEGNAFEADVVAGVESAGDADEKEVRTHEVPEDDVPEEYLDKE
jgi:hypothetical protein